MCVCVVHMWPEVCEADTVIPDARGPPTGRLLPPRVGLHPPESAVRQGVPIPSRGAARGCWESEPLPEPCARSQSSQGCPPLEASGPRALGVSLGACTQPEQPGPRLGTFRPWPYPPFTSSEAKERRRRAKPPPAHSALMVLLHPARSWEMLSKTCSPSAPGPLLSPRQCSSTSSSATSSCQTAASRAEAARRPVALPSTWVLLPARSKQTLWGQWEDRTWLPASTQALPSHRGWGWVGR